MSSDSTPRTAAGRPYITSEDIWDAWDESRPQDADGRHMIRLAEAVNRRIHTEAASPAASGDALREALERLMADVDRYSSARARSDLWGAMEQARAALAATPPLPEGLDVERLARAIGRTPGFDRDGDYAERLAAEYARLASREGAE